MQWRRPHHMQVHTPRLQHNDSGTQLGICSAGPPAADPRLDCAARGPKPEEASPPPTSTCERLHPDGTGPRQLVPSRSCLTAGTEGGGGRQQNPANTSSGPDRAQLSNMQRYRTVRVIGVARDKVVIPNKQRCSTVQLLCRHRRGVG